MVMPDVVKIIIGIGIVGRLAIAPVFAQQNAFSTEPQEFYNDYRKRLGSLSGVKEANSMVRELDDAWKDGALSDSDWRELIKRINALVGKGLKIWPDVAAYASGFINLKRGYAVVPVNAYDYLQVIDECVGRLGAMQCSTAAVRIASIVHKGIVFKTEYCKWKIRTGQIRLGFDDSGPYFLLNNSQITFVSSNDSSHISGANGSLNVLTQIFTGKGGKYDWSRVHLEPAQVFCVLGDYTVDMKTVYFRAEDVEFHYKGLLDRPLKGILEEHFLHFKTDKLTAEYPYFRSTEGGVKIEHFVRNVLYEGGFSLKGVTKIGSATEKAPARLFIKRRSGETVAKLETDEVLLNPVEMIALNSRVTLYMTDGDTLYHAKMRMRYLVESELLTLSLDRTDKASRQPVLDSYHKMGLYFDAIRWVPGSDTIAFTSLVDRPHKLFAVESLDYFRFDRYWQYKGTLRFNPILAIYKFYRFRKAVEAAKHGKETVLEEEAPVHSDPSEFGVWDDYGGGEGGDGGSGGGDDFGGDHAAEDAAIEYLERKDDAGDDPQVLEKEHRTILIPELLAFTRMTRKQRNAVLKNPSLLDKYLGITPKDEEIRQFMPLLDDLVGAGLVDYEKTTGRIVVRDLLIAWAKAAMKKKDYDVISIPSKADQGNNAEWIYSSKLLILHGVTDFVLSDSQYVVMRPEDETIYIQENRNFYCGGLLKAGKINLVGKPGNKRFRFVYDDFKIDCDSIRHMTFYPERDPQFEKHRVLDEKAVKGLAKLKIENLAGTVYIDRPNNKNGRKPRPEYSMFDCHTESYVYWSDTSIQKGVYTKDKLYFVVEPFLIDSLETFAINSLFFMGELNTGDIMPEFRDTLKPVADGTFGIREIVPEYGVPLYRDKGRFFDEITMDSYGLHGRGKIEYLSGVAESDTFVFHFDSVMAFTKSFYMPRGEHEGYYFPELRGGRFKYTWYPHEDRLVLQTTEEALSVFEGRGLFRGKITISPGGVVGDGTLWIGNEEFYSRNFDFQENRFQTQDGEFSINDPYLPTKQYFYAKNVAMSREMDSELVTFETVAAKRDTVAPAVPESSGAKTPSKKSKKSKIESPVETAGAAIADSLARLQPGQPNLFFPQHGFSTTLDKGTYDKIIKKVVLNSKDEGLKSHYFVATDSSLHGLKFPVKTAELDMAKEIIYADGVDSIRVADAIVFPEIQSLRIDAGGILEPMEHARIVVGPNDKRYHWIEDATVQIVTGIAYNASGEYHYKFKDVDQIIRFDNINVRPDTVTLGYAVIPEEQNFFITERFYFRDTVEIVGNLKYLNFRGQVKIQSENPALSESWIDVRADNVNPDSVIVPVDSSVLKDLAVGVYFIPKRSAFYSKFLEKKFDRNDVAVLSSAGSITFDLSTNEFRIGALDKLKRTRFKGNVVGYNDSKNVITSEGFINFPYHLHRNKFFSMQMAGRWRENNDKGLIETDLTWTIDFPVEIKEVMTRIGGVIRTAANAAEEVRYKNNRFLMESIAEIIDAGDPAETKTRALADDAEVHDETYPLMIGKTLTHSLAFTGVKFTYCDEILPVFYSDKNIGVMAIQGITVSRYVRSKTLYSLGRLLASKAYAPDTVRILLEFSDYDEFVYFEFYDNTLKLETTAANVIAISKEIAAKLNKKGAKPDAFHFVYLEPELGSTFSKELNHFKRRFSALVLSGCGKDISGEKAPTKKVLLPDSNEEKNEDETAPAERDDGGGN
jgi:hypothetical protein